MNLIGVKSQVNEIIGNEKIYGNQGNKQLKEFLERGDNFISISEPSEVIAESARKHNPLKSNNLFENEKLLPQSSKPNMKFKYTYIFTQQSTLEFLDIPPNQLN